MPNKATPMLHVPDVEATTEWYRSIGFEVRDKGSDGQDIVFALLAFGNSELMLSAGGEASVAWRREVDLYVEVDDLDAAFRKVDGKAELVEDRHETFYGMREFIIRDINRFWITFGQRAVNR